jgi:hypothetical protein
MTKKTPFELILGYTPMVQQPCWTIPLPGIEEQLNEILQHRQEAQDAIAESQ